MTHIEVWSPKSDKVELECGGRLFPLAKQSRGWWSIETAYLSHGIDYAFRLDDSAPLPDPRSPWQPYGVHGCSRHVEHMHFCWNDKNWQPPLLASGLIYELHIGTFSVEGTFAGAMKHLSHLRELGVTHVELMPVAEFAGDRGWGYDTVNLYAPHHTYGGPEGLKSLINMCHNMGLGVILDVVYNHLGPEGNYLDKFGPYFTESYITPWGPAINLDGTDSDIVRRYFIDNALMWLRDYHADALRIDAIHAIFDTSAIHFLEQLRTEVDALAISLGRHLSLVAESDLNDPRIINNCCMGGYGFNAQWNEDFHHALHALLSKERSGYYVDFGSVSQLGKALSQGFVYDGCYSGFRHRNHGRPLSNPSGHKLVGFMQNHDQVGNRVSGKRSSHLLDTARLKLATTLVLTAPFIPMLFQGEEWGASTPFLFFTSYTDEELGKAVTEGRKQEFSSFDWDPSEVPDPQDQATYERSKLDWKELEHESCQEILAWHKELIRLRHRFPALGCATLNQTKVTIDEDKQWLHIRRSANKCKDVMILCNFSSQDRSIPLLSNQQVELLASTSCNVNLKQKTAIVPGAGAVIVKVEGTK